MAWAGRLTIQEMAKALERDEDLRKWVQALCETIHHYGTKRSAAKKVNKACLAQLLLFTW